MRLSILYKSYDLALLIQTVYIYGAFIYVYMTCTSRTIYMVYLWIELIELN